MARRVMLVLLILLGVALLYQPASASAPETNNAVSATATAGQIAFTNPHGSVWIQNDGSNEVYVRVWQRGETVVTMTTSLAGAVKINPGEWRSFDFDPRWESGGGYMAIGYVCDTAETATFRYIAK